MGRTGRRTRMPRRMKNEKERLMREGWRREAHSGGGEVRGLWEDMVVVGGRGGEVDGGW